MSLSVRAIETARPGDKPQKMYDEKGLYLVVAASGSKRRYMKYTFLGKEQKLCFGAFPEVSPKAARAKRDEARTLIAEGRNPSREKRAAKLVAKAEADNTFASLAREYNDMRKQRLAAATIEKTEWLLTKLMPELGRVPVADISAPMLLKVLREIQDLGTRETARRLRSYIYRVLDYAIIKDSNAIRAIYNRTTYWNERVAMMQWWSDNLDRLKAEAAHADDRKAA